MHRSKANQRHGGNASRPIHKVSRQAIQEGDRIQALMRATHRCAAPHTCGLAAMDCARRRP